MNLTQSKKKLLPHLLSIIPVLLEHHITLLRKFDGTKPDIEDVSNRFRNNLVFLFNAVFLDEAGFALAKAETEEDTYQRGKYFGRKTWSTLHTILEINHHSRLKLLHYVLECLAHEPDHQVNGLIIKRLNELLSIRQKSYVVGYLTEKNEQMNHLHQQKIQVMGQMAAGMAHEIRNPLTSFQGFLQLMKQNIERGQTDPEAFLRYLNICLDEVKTVEGVVSNFLILARKNEDVENQLHPLELRTVLNRIHELTKHFVIEKDVLLQFHFDADSYWIRGVPSYIEQIALNLIKNAVDAVPIGGQVMVNTCQDPTGKSVTIQIIDNGCGISPKRMLHLFEPFYTTKEKGTGIGLSVCKKLVDEMGGTIELVSTENIGTCVEVKLQLEAVGQDKA
ncbi:sensor histidine kinase [Brevibacillus dissolubilis]|uniref:sensor histidine kinase n=1 Tax=Brevibacillus dissolubilis TaxID=1844116 RepID=UPI00159BB15E|nr:HAMP domain-containing sensor histidine kinase [Brevibacillus dissolubilis]